MGFVSSQISVGLIKWKLRWSLFLSAIDLRKDPSLMVDIPEDNLTHYTVCVVSAELYIVLPFKEIIKNPEMNETLFEQTALEVSKYLGTE